jgi:bacillopeptidase F
MPYSPSRYSRLQRLEEKRNVRKATFLTLGGVAIVALVIVIGIPLLVKLLLFMGNLKSANQPVDKTDLIPPGPPQLIVPYDATNSATLTISGIAEPGSTVFLTDNSDTLGNVVVADDGTFNYVDNNLDDGTNQIVAVAVDQAGNKSQPSQTTQVIYSKVAPKLELSAPTDRQTFSGDPARTAFTGKTDPDVRLTVNDRVIIVDSAGNFTSTFNLNPGDNTLVVIATNKAGNQTRKELVVTYNP